MSLTALAWLTIYGVGCVLALIRHPIYGLLTYLFEYFNHPPVYWWGKSLPHFRWSFFIAIVTLISVVIRWNHYRPIRIPPLKWLLALTALAFVVTYTTAASPSLSQTRAVALLKLALLYFLMVRVVQSEREYRLLVWAILLGCFLFGWRAYQNPSLQAGRLENIGGVDTSDANGLASLMLIPVPFLGFYALTRKGWERILSILVIPFILNAWILCDSRGALLGFAAAGGLMLFPALKVLKFRFVLAILLGAILLSQLVDQRFIDRMTTMKEGTEITQSDASAGGRITSWKGGWHLLLDHPWGAGGEAFLVLSPIYIPEIVAAHGGQRRAPHNTFLKVATDWGFLGAFLWLAFLGSTCVQLHRLRRKGAKMAPRYRAESVAIESALLAFLVAGIFTDQFYTEALYWVCALGAALPYVKEYAGQQETEDPQGFLMRWAVRRQMRKAQKLSPRLYEVRTDFIMKSGPIS